MGEAVSGAAVAEVRVEAVDGAGRGMHGMRERGVCELEMRASFLRWMC